MINHVIDTSKKAGINAILGHKSDMVRDVIPKDIEVITQEKQLGTGHAVMIAKERINDDDIIIVLCGDSPLIQEDTIRKLFNYHKQNNYSATAFSTDVDNPTGYGRIIRDINGDLLKIVEEKDTTEEEKTIKEINSGVCCFNGKELKESFKYLSNNNTQDEYYLTSVMEIMRGQDLKVGAYKGSNIEELMGVNSREELLEAERIMERRYKNNNNS